MPGIIPGSVEIPTVKREGTSIRIFCLESAFFKSTLMEMGVRSVLILIIPVVEKGIRKEFGK